MIFSFPVIFMRARDMKTISNFAVSMWVVLVMAGCPGGREVEELNERMNERQY